MASSGGAWPRPGEAPDTADLARCVHCGLCLTSCPTYLVTGLETESPRGRISLARAVDDGRIELTLTVQRHWELCLQCRACEEACPSGVPYGRIIEQLRSQILARPADGRIAGRMRRLLLRQVIARPRVLGAVMAPARWLGGSRLRSPLMNAGLPGFASRLTTAVAQLPRHPGKPFRPGDSLSQPETARGAALLFTGCVMGELFGDVHRATGRVLARHGIESTAPKGQGCCGALHAHDGDIDFARKLARRTIDAFESAGEETVIVNSAGCGAAMKEYGELLAGDAAYAGRARAFSARVKDVTEYLVSLGAEVPAQFAARVSYQDPCHLAHVQRIREAPRALLRGVSGCELLEGDGDDTCCGAAGMYNLVQPEMAGKLRKRKADQFREHQPDVVVTANPGCQLQYEAAVREAGVKARVMHVVEFLDEAYRASADR